VGTLYKIICDSCFDERQLSYGDGMFHLQYQCNSCFKLFNIPRKAPRPNRNGREVPKFLEKHDFKSLPPTPINEIIHFTDEYLNAYLKARSQWCHGGDEWDSYEIGQLISLVSCECNDIVIKISEQSQLRTTCFKCGSLNIDFVKIGASD
jgi:hypothetical protein